jgi:hypothetical protein
MSNSQRHCLKRQPLTVPLQTANPLVFMIIDGDGAIFREDLISKGEEGGAEAAHLLQMEIKNYLKNLYPDSNLDSYSVMVQVMLNMDGLSRALVNASLIQGGIHAFARAFGRSQPLFSFIDVGAGKERADHKICSTLRVMFKLAQCKHILFAPCNDNGYLPFFDEFKQDASIAWKVTLVETTPAEPGFLKLGFKVTSFPRVFKSDPLITAKPAHKPAPLVKTLSILSPVLDPTPADATDMENGAKSWSNIARSGPTSAPSPLSVRKLPDQRFYLVNSQNDRVDPALPRYEFEAERKFKEKTGKNGNFCNERYLIGKCTKVYCNYQHDEKLSPAELLVLKHKARSLRCTWGSECREIDCYQGHHCRNGVGCTRDGCLWDHIDAVGLKRVVNGGNMLISHSVTDYRLQLPRSSRMEIARICDLSEE